MGHEGERTRERSAQHAVVPAEKKLSAGICIEYSLTFLARLPLRRRIGRLRCAAHRRPAAGVSLYHCAYLCTLIISNMVRALSSRTTAPCALLLSPLSPRLSLYISLGGACVKRLGRGVRGLVYTYLGGWMECAPTARVVGALAPRKRDFDSFSRRSISLNGLSMNALYVDTAVFNLLSGSLFRKHIN